MTCFFRNKNMLKKQGTGINVEQIAHMVFLFLGIINVGFVLVICIYLVIAGLPAIKEIGLVDFLFGTKWASTAANPQFGILPFILTSIYGTAGAIIIGLPLGFFTAVYLAKFAPRPVYKFVSPLIDLLAGIPSVVYGFIGMLVLVPGIQVIFNLPDGSSLLASILVLAIMILVRLKTGLILKIKFYVKDTILDLLP